MSSKITIELNLPLSGGLNRNWKISTSQPSLFEHYSCYVIVIDCTHACIVFPVPCLHVQYVKCVSGFRLGIEWPEGGSSTNVTLGKREKETDEVSSIQPTDAFSRAPLFLHPVFISIVVTDFLHWLRNMALLLHLHLFASSLYWVSLVGDVHSHTNSTANLF